jgi:dihydroneopterin aldolase
MGAWPILPPPGQRCIVIDDLRLEMFIGVNEHEKRARQEVSISVLMLVADAGSMRSDALADVVSYSDIIARLKERAGSARHVNLVETLAEEVADLALADARVGSVLVDVRKTKIVPEAKSVGVTIHRQRAPVPRSG